MSPPKRPLPVLSILTDPRRTGSTAWHTADWHRAYFYRAATVAGVAGRLMLAVHGAARELGGRHLWLGVWERNPRAIAFYAKSGFVHAGSHDFFVGADRQTDHVLVAPVQRPTGGEA